MSAEGNTPYEPGDLVPKKGYFGVCPNCGAEFTGRRNQKYCSEECRVQFNNHKRNEQGTPGKIRKQTKADRVLHKLYLQFESRPFSEDVLTAMGFPQYNVIFESLPTEMGVMEGYLNFALMRDTEKGEVRIYPIEVVKRMSIEFELSDPKFDSLFDDG